MQIFAKKKKGFTLIELLVVIAIIGILASIVLVSLGGARTRARETRIISDMTQLRSQGEIIYSNYNDYDEIGCTSYGTTCDCTDVNIKKLCEDIHVQGAKAGTMAINKETSPADAYCAEVELPSSTTASPKWYCVDSTMTSKQYSAAPTCSTTVFTCE